MRASPSARPSPELRGRARRRLQRRDLHRPEANDQKAIQIRGTVRPMRRRPNAARPARHGSSTTPTAPWPTAPGTGSWGPHLRTEYVHAGASSSPRRIALPHAGGDGGRGLLGVGHPQAPFGLEGLFGRTRWSRTRPWTPTKDRTIAGLSYWFPRQGPVSAALLLDYERWTARLPAKPQQKRVALHALFNF